MRDMVVTMEGRGTMEGLNTDRINQSTDMVEHLNH